MTPGPGIEPGTHWWKASALTTIPQEVGIHTACNAYEAFYKKETAIQTHAHKKMLRLVLQEITFYSIGKEQLLKISRSNCNKKKQVRKNILYCV